MEVHQNIENNFFINIFKGVGIAFITTTILLLIFSAILTFTNINENVINPVIITATGISILIGSSIGNNKSSIGNNKIKKNGLLNGALVGAIYILIIYIISSLLNWRFNLNMQSLIMIAVGMIFGMLGGIIGVNKS